MSIARVLSATALAAGLLVSFRSEALDIVGVFQMRLDNNASKCLDFTAGDMSNNVTLQLWGCANNYNHQLWWVYGLPYAGNDQIRVMFQNFNNATCIAVENDSIANGARLVQRICDVNNPSQQWIRLTRGPNMGDRSKFMNIRSGKCMDAPYSSNGTVLQQWDCASASYWPQQMFRGTFIPVQGPPIWPL
ncbi:MULTISPECIES: RICIN domain-containing protein [unclassified Pseudoxanthomonas]|uniref:RICIN domain-containing protein n=1 Tax=unclassified Pseudoxanthomonas TaxID=2645906 RepID=UPI001617F98D|nr:MULTISPECIES: RICIN domain-containing protein [unclassified Pseudoxanthomonas]MBB3275971.1 hypothetical protein [Pseudoxanthomonas sp. OG2]MBD9379408.1 ricin-type beta-trefoil lectin domain protein [Pseudoxanthomonas sp. PXM04]MBV7472948.1 RICIN domain-containing protein [Pseudoxanthomonas sp. PXM05]